MKTVKARVVEFLEARRVMAHSNRDKRKAARLAQKRARKASWASLIGTSQNKKLKSQEGSLKRRPPMAKIPMLVAGLIKGKEHIKSVMVHQGPKCFNIGCKRCSPVARRVTA